MSSCSDNRCSSLIHLNGTNVWTEKEEGTSGSENWTYFGLPTFLVHELHELHDANTYLFRQKRKKNTCKIELAQSNMGCMGLIWSVPANFLSPCL